MIPRGLQGEIGSVLALRLVLVVLVQLLVQYCRGGG
jgi:hypothetical protein